MRYVTHDLVVATIASGGIDDVHGGRRPSRSISDAKTGTVWWVGKVSRRSAVSALPVRT